MQSKVQNRLFNRSPELEPLWEQLWQWYASAPGRQLVSQEQALLQGRLVNMFGYHLVQLGRINGLDAPAASRVSHGVIVDFWRQDPDRIDNEQRLRGSPQALPIQSDSVDVVVLPHVLEFAESPHEVLREVERILIPEGNVVILCFNPWSLWSLWRWTAGRGAGAPWCGRFFSITRIRDWLSLLGFEVGDSEGYFFQPPVKREALLQRLGWLDRAGKRLLPFMGAANVLTAKKRVITLTPMRPRWRPKRQAVVNGLKPTNRVARQGAQRDGYGENR